MDATAPHSDSPGGSNSSAIYFPNLNGIRFFAALLVFIYHVSDISRVFGLPSIGLPLINDWGKKGVAIFFVLSGFLITYLLLAEQKKTANIDIRKFYVRRLLRIWPLYYLIIFIGYFVFPYVSGLYKPVFNADFALFLAFLPNLAGGSTWFVLQTWSVGVEEQFYLLWPLLMRRFAKVLPWLFAAVVLVKLGIMRIIDWMLVAQPTAFLVKTREVLYYLQFELMAIGAAGAYLLFHQRSAVLKFIFNPAVEKLNLLLMLVIFITPYGAFRFSPWVYGCLFLVFIMNAAANKQSVIRLEAAPFRYLGSISYGIYMYHQMVIASTMLLLQALSVPINWQAVGLFQLAVYPLALALTVVVAGASHRWLELPFIKAGKHYSVIAAGPGYTRRSVSAG